MWAEVEGISLLLTAEALIRENQLQHHTTHYIMLVLLTSSFRQAYKEASVPAMSHLPKSSVTQIRGSNHCWIHKSKPTTIREQGTLGWEVTKPGAYFPWHTMGKLLTHWEHWAVFDMTVQ